MANKHRLACREIFMLPAAGWVVCDDGMSLFARLVCCEHFLPKQTANCFHTLHLLYTRQDSVDGNFVNCYYLLYEATTKLV